MMAYRIPPDLLDAFARDWQAAPHQGKAGTVARYAALIGCSEATLYRRMRRRLGRQKALAPQAGQRQKSVPDYVIDMAEEIIERGRLFGDDARRLPAGRVLEKLARRGVAPADVPSASTLNRRLRERGSHQERRRRRVEADFALERVLWDASRSEYFQLKGRDRERGYILECRGKHLAYKDNNIALRTWILSLVDDHSRMTWAKMYEASGESGALGLVSLMDFFSTDDNESLPEFRHFHHAPWLLQTDFGAFGRSGAVAASLDACSIEFKPASKESQGKVERQFRTLWSDFELDLAEDLGKGAKITLDEYNVLLRAYCIKQGRRQHPRRAGTREQVYLASLRAHEPRTLDADLLRLAYSVKTPTIDRYGHVHVGGTELVVPAFCADDQGGQIAMAPGMKISVLPNLRGEYVGRLCERYSEPFVLIPFEPAAYGDFSGGHALSRRERIQRGISLRQPGAEAARKHLPEGQPSARAAAKASATKVHTLPHVSRAIEPSSPFLPVAGGPMIAPIEARILFSRRLAPYGYAYSDFSADLDAVLGERGLTRHQLDQLIADVIKAVA